MPTIDSDHDLVISPLAFEILSDLVKQTETATNDILDLQQGEINFWQTKFVELFESMLAVSNDVSNPQLDEALTKAEPFAARAAEILLAEVL